MRSASGAPRYLAADAGPSHEARRRADAARRHRTTCSICGASFAGLMVARELAGSGADVLVVDRYEIGERQTSACGIPTEWLRVLGLLGAERQRFDSLVVHTPHGDSRYRLPWTFSTFDYRELCELLWEGCDADLRDRQGQRARPRARNGSGEIAVETDRGVISAPLVVDALGWRRMLATGDGYQPPDAPLSRGLEVHPDGAGEDMEIWIDRRYVPGRLRLELSRRRGAADRRRLLRPPLPRPRDDRAAGRRPRLRAGPLPGQLDPPQAAPGDRGRRLLRRRLGGPLPAADRRGDPHRALLRHRPRARAARRRRRRAQPRAGGGRATPSSATRTSGSSAGCCAPSGSSPGSRRACSARLIRAARREALRRLVLRPLPADRAARVRGESGHAWLEDGDGGARSPDAQPSEPSERGVWRAGAGGP